MRCLLLIACLALANASYFTKNRFNNLLNRYQNQYDQTDNLFGSDDVDDYQQDYVDQIRRQQLYGRGQCPRFGGQCSQNFQDIFGIQDQYDTEDLEGFGQGGLYQQDWEDQIQGGYGQRNWGQRGMGQRDLYQDDWEDQMQGGYGQQDWDNTCQGGQCDMEDIFQGQFGQQDWEDQIQGGIGQQDWEGLGQGGYSMLDDEGTQQGVNHLIKEVEDANIKLTTRLYKQCKDEKDDKNTVVSPLSVQLALAALNNGARGNTRRQIGRVIGGRLQKQERKQIFKTLIRHLKGLRQTGFSSQKQCKINPVTGIFVSQLTRAQQQFVQQVKTTLGANVKHCNFQRQPQQCRQMINQFVSQKTQHKINQIVPQDAITDNTKMLLVNALELKANWGPQMRRHVTKEAKFYPLETSKVKIVEVLETQGRFKYYEDELVKVVGIPTQQKQLTLFVIVPKDKDGLTDVEKLHLQDSVELKKLLDKTNIHTRNVHVQLPKFQIKHKVDVRRTLRKQGVTDAFDPKRADFSGITGVPRFQIDEMEDSYQGIQGQHSFRRNPFLDIQNQNQYNRRNFMDMDMDTDYETMGYGQGIGQQGQDHKLHLNKFIHQCTVKITENGITATTGSQSDQYEQQYGRQFGRQYGRQGQSGLEFNEYESFGDITGVWGRGQETGSQKTVKANHAFAFVLKHNPTKQVVMVGRVIDAAQEKVNYVPQTINVVDQL